MRGFYFPATVKNRVFSPQIWPTGGPIGTKGLTRRRMAIILSASSLGAPDLFKLRNQTAAYWAAHHWADWQQAGACVSLSILLFRCAAPFE